jgi:U3 small nucleolar RNA-associated protein 20
MTEDRAEYFTIGFLKLVSTFSVGGLGVFEVPESNIESFQKWDFVSTWEKKKVKDRVMFHLKMFSQLKRITRLKDSHLLHSIFTKMICSPESDIQSKALECLLAYKEQPLCKYGQAILKLCVDDKFKDELTNIQLEGDNALILPNERDAVIPVLLRILYGRMLSKKGSNSGRNGVKSRRNAILLFLSGCKRDELAFFLDLILEAFKPLRNLSSRNSDGEFVVIADLNDINLPPVSVQVAYIMVLEDLIKQLPRFLHPFFDDLFKVLFYLVHIAYNYKQFDLEDAQVVKKLKDIKQQGVRRIAEMFQIDELDFTPYMKALFESVFSSRISVLDSESITTPSIFMDIFNHWSSEEDTAPFLIQYDNRLIPQLLNCIAHPKVHQSVLSKVTETIENIVKLDEETEGKPFINQILVPYIPNLLHSFGTCLKIPTSHEGNVIQKYAIIRRQISILSKLAEFMTSPDEAILLMNTIGPMLRIPARFFPDESKEEVLQILLSFLPLMSNMRGQSYYQEPLYKMLSLLLVQLSERRCRLTLLACFNKLAEFHEDLVPVAAFLMDVNSFSLKHIDVPDYERRIRAFVEFNENQYASLSGHQWLPILYNMIFFCYDDQEIAMRTNASFGITRFIERAQSGDAALKDMMIQILLPTIKKSMRSTSLHVRSEFLSVLSRLIESFPEDVQFSDMVCLLGVDEETNFFNNITHIQVHRRIRSLHRFCNVLSEDLKIRQKSLVSIFLPLLFQYLKDENTDSNLVAEVCKATGVISTHLHWHEYNHLVSNIFNLLRKFPEKEKIYLNVLRAVLEGFHFELEEEKQEDDVPMEDAVEDDLEIQEADADDEPVLVAQKTKAYDTLKLVYIPRLNSLLEGLDDESLKRRMPLAITAVKLLKRMPAQDIRQELPKVLITTCQLLRHRMDGVRDRARATLAQILEALGPLYFTFIVREASVALTKGYQLHVLSYTVYELFQKLVPIMEVGDIEECTDLLVDIFLRDIFGSVGEEKDAEDFAKKIKEAKKCRSFDAFELMATKSKMTSLGKLLIPLKEILSNTESPKIIAKVETLLKHIRLGFCKNTSRTVKDSLVLINNLIKEKLAILQPQVTRETQKTMFEQTFTVQRLKRSNDAVTQDMYKQNSYRFIQFGLDMMLWDVKNNFYNLRDENHMAMLDPIISAICQCCYSPKSLLIVVAVKILSLVVKFPLPSLVNAIPGVVKQIFRLIETTGSSKTELVQACLRFLASAIRLNSNLDLKRKHIVLLLNLLRPDLQDSTRHTTTFALIKSIVTRKVIVEEVYDIMEEITQIMVTNQSPQVREQCRFVYLQFLLDYPQGKLRLTKQFNFLINNLSYEFESGRESVMEMLHVIFVKVDQSILAEFNEVFFVALVMRLISDDSAKCREMAGTLVKLLISKVSEAQLQNIEKLAESWFKQSDQIAIKRGGAQVFGFLVEVLGAKYERRSSRLLGLISSVLANAEHSVKEWELVYCSLNTLSKLFKEMEHVKYDREHHKLWTVIRELLLFPHAWVRLACARLFGSYFANLQTEQRPQPAKELLKDNLILSANFLQQVAFQHCVQLESEYVSEELSVQIVKNLLFMAKCFYYIPEANSSKLAQDNQENDSEDDSECEESTKSMAGNKQHDSFYWLLRKLAFKCRTEGTKGGMMVRLFSLETYSLS